MNQEWVSKLVLMHMTCDWNCLWLKLLPNYKVCICENSVYSLIPDLTYEESQILKLMSEKSTERCFFFFYILSDTKTLYDILWYFFVYEFTFEIACI